MGRRRVLLSAYFCSPGKGSEYAVGWDCATTLAERRSVWVLTRRKYREAIEAALKDRPNEHLHFVYLDLPQWLHFWESEQGFTLFYYYIWQLMAPILAHRVCRKERIDVVHHVTTVKYWAPSLMGILPIPFVWGPVGGGESAPYPFMAGFSLHGQIYEILRDVARRVSSWDPLVRLTARSCTLALATTQATADAIGRMCPREIYVNPAIGLLASDFQRLGKLEFRDRATLRFITIGRMLHWKGIHLGVQAFAEADLDDCEYWLIGDGTERKRLEALVERLGVLSTVKFWGELPRRETLGRLQQCDVLVHPSLHDSGGIVCLEAMAARRPVVCLDIGGPSVLVTAKCAIKVSTDGGPERSVHDLASAMRSLAENADLRHEMGEAGHQRVAEMFLWERKAEYYDALYEHAVALAGRAKQKRCATP